jgi:phage-related protein
MTLQNGEEVLIDFARGTITSSVRGSLFYTLLAASDFRAFTLLPGDNKIACFMVNDVDAKMTIQFQPAHWSADAMKNTESL